MFMDMSFLDFLVGYFSFWCHDQFYANHCQIAPILASSNTSSTVSTLIARDISAYAQKPPPLEAEQ